jgi:hypothetical protein
MSHTATRIADTSGPRNWPLVARERLTVDGTVYNRGTELPVTKMTPAAIERLLHIKAAEWLPPLDGRPKPQPLPAAPVPKPRPPVVIIDHKSPIESWHLTKTALVAACDNNVGLAQDLLMADPKARNLYLLASKEAQRSL